MNRQKNIIEQQPLNSLLISPYVRNEKQITTKQKLSCYFSKSLLIIEPRGLKKHSNYVCMYVRMYVRTYVRMYV